MTSSMGGLGLPAPKSEASKDKRSLLDYEVYSGLEVHNWPVFRSAGRLGVSFIYEGNEFQKAVRRSIDVVPFEIGEGTFSNSQSRLMLHLFRRSELSVRRTHCVPQD